MLNAEDYLNKLIMRQLPKAAAGHSIEVAIEEDSAPSYTDGVSLIFDDTRIYFSLGLTFGDQLLLQFVAPVYRDFSPSTKLVEAVAHTSKVLVGVSLVKVGEITDLVLTSDLLLTRDPKLDAVNLAAYLEAVHTTHELLWDEWGNL
jgi:hypothetical protein